ncbi:hypothetical protein NBT05_07570 [Aquimarina sp. ERC-38]|uniref:hypothetical protein n=1 Tax=Aquimarina sp. ERC-38 TaxID=2949996 RepID=UPI002247999E|nr:hypothetical protein [Aquimarina sp. ERC-38]UZO82324.1 hypothetical protein NBT05_07570 [Aquimarina sp. ERC-38]
MKKLLHRNLVVLVVTVSLLTACDQIQQKGNGDDQSVTIKKLRSKVDSLQNIIKQDKTVDEEFLSRFYIDTTKIRSFETAYTVDRLNIVQKELGIKDPRSIWFPIKQIKEYIKYTELEAQKKNYKNLGLKFYFGVNNIITRDYIEKGKLTLFMIGTTQSPKNQVRKNNNSTQLVQSVVNEDKNRPIEGMEASNFGHMGGDSLVPED